LEDIKYGGNKKTWVFQQMLKLYSYRVLQNYGLSDTLLLLDSDTVLVHSLPMRTPDGRLFVNIASEASGAFSNDAGAGSGILNELFDGKIPKAYPDFQQYKYTAITHHMMIDGAILEQLLTTSKPFSAPLGSAMRLPNLLTEWNDLPDHGNHRDLDCRPHPPKMHGCKVSRGTEWCVPC
jgi:hypothetical protein